MEGYQKVAAFLEASGLLEGKLSLSIDVRVIQLYATTYFSAFFNYIQSVCTYSTICTVCCIHQYILLSPLCTCMYLWLLHIRIITYNIIIFIYYYY